MEGQRVGWGAGLKCVLAFLNRTDSTALAGKGSCGLAFCMVARCPSQSGERIEGGGRTGAGLEYVEEMLIGDTDGVAGCPGLS